MTDLEQNSMENENVSMEAAMESVHEVQVGDIVKGEVLALEDKQVIVGIEGAGSRRCSSCKRTFNITC
jgi:small subunit ribosomal protein S1